jgi:hypothetical protein
VPTEVPVLSAVVGQHHEVTVYVSKPQLGRPVEFLKNPKYYGFTLKYKVENASEWTQIVSTKLHYTLVFDEHCQGKFLLLHAAWVNPRIQNGPRSEEVRELVN